MQRERSTRSPVRTTRSGSSSLQWRTISWKYGLPTRPVKCKSERWTRERPSRAGGNRGISIARWCTSSHRLSFLGRWTTKWCGWSSAARERDAVEDVADALGAEDLGRAMEDVPLQPGGNDRRGDRPADGQVGQQGRRGRTQELAGEDLLQRRRIDRPGPPGDGRRQGRDRQQQETGRRADDRPGPARRMDAVDRATERAACPSRASDRSAASMAAAVNFPTPGAPGWGPR